MRPMMMMMMMMIRKLPLVRPKIVCKLRTLMAAPERAVGSTSGRPVGRSLFRLPRRVRRCFAR